MARKDVELSLKFLAKAQEGVNMNLLTLQTLL